jgi:hypothetical protein
MRILNNITQLNYREVFKIKKTLWKKRMLAAIALTPFLASCGGLGYTPPPGAKLGDAFLSLKVTTDDRGRMAEGSDVVISIENTSAEDTKNQVIIGDVVKLSQGDTGIKVNFPIDKNKLSECGASMSCYIYVKIVKNGTTYYKTNTPAPYKAGQTNAAITISKAT